jgi:hypothetical protein
MVLIFSVYEYHGLYQYGSFCDIPSMETVINSIPPQIAEHLSRTFLEKCLAPKLESKMVIILWEKRVPIAPCRSSQRFSTTSQIFGSAAFFVRPKKRRYHRIRLSG